MELRGVTLALEDTERVSLGAAVSSNHHLLDSNDEDFFHPGLLLATRRGDVAVPDWLCDGLIES